ncbi:MAG: PHB depolymerase family esterase [Ferruginibacter sp.]
MNVFIKKVLIIAAVFILKNNTAFAQQNIEGRFNLNNVTREYMLHLPTDYSASKQLPLVMIFHGGGGNAKQMQRYMKMDAIADRESFITVYPQGINKQWNDGREFKASISENDDVQFISQLLDSLKLYYAVDMKKVFATGISNGGFFSIYLSYKLSDRFLAVAPVCASIPQRIDDEFRPAVPVSFLLINGTKDPLVPYNGGEVGNKLTGNRGGCTSTEKTIKKYLAIDGITSAAVTENIPDENKTDNCTAVKYTYRNESNGTNVTLIKIINGGHALPGGSQYLPKIIIGKVCKDFDANEIIWEFFKDRPLRL